MSWDSVAEIVSSARAAGIRISDAVLGQYDEGERTRILDGMGERLRAMQGAAQRGLEERLVSRSGLSGGAARKVEEARLEERSAVGGPFSAAMSRSLAVAEVNACMGRIVAAPTAGSCGVIPGVLLALSGAHSCDDRDVVMALLTAAAVGEVISTRATVSGAEGGCQAECGAAAAMAAAAGVESCGGSPEQCAHAAAISLKGLLGLVCDPVAGAWPLLPPPWRFRGEWPDECHGEAGPSSLPVTPVSA